MNMGAYREQLLKEHQDSRKEEEPGGFFLVFKIRFLICLVLFGIFSYLWFTDSSIGTVTAETILENVTEDAFSEELHLQMQKLGL